MRTLPALALSFAGNLAAAADLPEEAVELSHQMQRLSPWMWLAGGLLWVALVVVAAKLIDRGLARLAPAGRSTWLGRIFRVFAYGACAVIAVTLFLHGFGAADLAAPLLRVERKIVILAAAFGAADLALILVNFAIDRYLAHLDGDGQKVERSPRVLTLLPLLRNVTMVGLGAILTLIVLGEFGVNIAPLLAGAGVVGVAVGFGAQKLVQDVITGAFILFENTVAVGDWVKISEHVGMVEGMTIRTLRLRDASGQIHTVPFSTVTNVINMSRDFGYHNFEINITYDTDIEAALAAIAAVAAELQADPATSPDILAPAELYGVERLGEWSVVLSGRIKTPPLRQPDVARAFNRKIKERFDRLGLKLAERSRLVAVSERS